MIKVISYEQLERILTRSTLAVSHFITPINLLEEKEKFLSSKHYEPQFLYSVKKKNIEKGLHALREIRHVKYVEGVPDGMVKYLKMIIKSKLNTADLISKIGKNKEFNIATQAKYMIPSEVYFMKATKLLRGKSRIIEYVDVHQDDKEVRYSSEDLFVLVERFLRKLKIDFTTEDNDTYKRTNDEYIELLRQKKGIPYSWCIKYKNDTSKSVTIGNKFRYILIPKDSTFSKLRMKKILVHEIGTHLLRSINGVKLGYEIFGKATVAAYLYTEEGLAVYNEEMYGLITKKSVKRMALLSYNVYLAHKYFYSFRDLYNLNIAFLPPKEAFSVAYRIKRGLSDTSGPGGYTKDATYFKGAILTQKRIKQDPNHYKAMYIGKVPFSWINVLKKCSRCQIIVPPYREVKLFLDSIK